MTFLEKLTSYRDRKVSVVHRYRLLVSSDKADYYFFVEGGDDRLFLKAAVRRVGGEDKRVHYLVCDGKASVLAVRERIKELEANGLVEGKGKVKLYFLDKDVDEFLCGGGFVRVMENGNDDVYCTEHYSIENYLVDRHMFDVIWSEIWRLEDSDARKDLLWTRFCQEHERFLAYMRVFMAWVIYSRRSGLAVKLRDLRLGRYFCVNEDLSLRSRGRALGRMRAEAGGRLGAEGWRTVREVARQLRQMESKKFLRGKFELWFFLAFMSRVEKTLRSAASAKSGPKPRVTLGVNNAVDLLADRCKFSRRLIQFLRTNFDYAVG